MSRFDPQPPTQDGVYGNANGGGSLDSVDDLSAWLNMSRQAFESSTTYMNASLRKQWDKNYRNFNSQHPYGSKYESEQYRHRSRLFRPRTRAMIRKAEATAVMAFFANSDLIDVQPHDDDDPIQLASAEINKELLQYRLEKTIPWFLTLTGAYQDCSVASICVSHQYWRHEVRKKGTRPKIGKHPETGEPTLEDEDVFETIFDKPVIELVPPENVRLDAAANWMDPVNSSPFLIKMIPMYVTDVETRTRTVDGKTGQPMWKPVTKDQILAARTEYVDSIRAAREGRDRIDSKVQQTTVTDFMTVWVHENFIRKDGRDWVFFTLGKICMLTEPVLTSKVYRHADKCGRPFVIGYATVEAHKPYPASKVQLSQDLQAELNDTTNQRLDNVKLSMNGRNFVREGAGVDLQALLRSVPGATILMENPETDVKTDRPPDVTATAYQEQDRLNIEFDEISGQTSPVSQQPNIALKNTLGGHLMLTAGSSVMSEYDLQVFAHTWVIKVLEQLLRMEQTYETDTTILALAGKKANLWEKYGVSAITDDLLDQELTTTINVGLAATDAQTRLGKLANGAQLLQQIFGQTIGPRLEQDPIIDEIFSLLGYKDGQRFFKPMSQVQNQPPPPDPKLMDAQTNQILAQAKIQLDQSKMKLDVMKGMVDHSRMQLEQQKAEREHEIALLGTQKNDGQDAQLQIAQLRAQTDLQKQKLANDGAVLAAAVKAQSDAEIQIRQLQQLQGQPIDAMLPSSIASDLGLHEKTQSMSDHLNGLTQLVGQMGQHAERMHNQANEEHKRRIDELQGHVAALHKAMTAPKEIVRDNNGRPVGVRTVLH